MIKATEYWTETNIADGLNALAICIEVRRRRGAPARGGTCGLVLTVRAQMVIFSSFMMHAYAWKEYVVKGAPKTSVWPNS